MQSCQLVYIFSSDYNLREFIPGSMHTLDAALMQQWAVKGVAKLSSNEYAVTRTL